MNKKLLKETWDLQKLIVFGISITLNLSGCAAALPLAAAGATYVMAKNSADTVSQIPQSSKLAGPTGRSDLDVLKDQNLETQVGLALTSNIPTGHYNVVSFEQKVLITGQVPTKADIAKATEVASTKIGGVMKTWNYLTVGPNETVDEIYSDTSLTKITKKRLLERQMGQQDVNSNNIVVATSKGIIYLIGSNAGNQQVIEEIMDGVKKTEGAKKVVNLIDQ